ncbi:Caffeoylshikimate esterase, partial [Mucuna pruriens]
MNKSILTQRPTKLYWRHPLNEFRASFCIQRRKRSNRREVMKGSRMRLPGVDEKLQKILDAKMDQVGARRHAREALKDIQLGIDHILFKVRFVVFGFVSFLLVFFCCGIGETKLINFYSSYLKKVDIINAILSLSCFAIDMWFSLDSYEKNSTGQEIFCKSWLPGESRPKAAIFYCHGIARKLASSGYAVFAMDYPGFGLSEGLHCFIPSFDRLVDGVIEHYSKIRENPEFHSLPSFLFGQSMGGAVALKIHLKQPKAWDGAVLVAPMCKIADDMVPPKLVTKVLIGLANVLPKHKLVPNKDLAEAAFRDLKKREQTAYNVIVYKDKPRLQSAVEMLKTTEEIEQRLKEVSLPLFILHGDADTVTDPSVSKALYEKASCSDKKLKLYKDAYHALLEGEPDEVITQVFGDIISWLDEHSLKHNQSSS